MTVDEEATDDMEVDRKRSTHDVWIGPLRFYQSPRLISYKTPVHLFVFPA